MVGIAPRPLLITFTSRVLLVLLGLAMSSLRSPVEGATVSFQRRVIDSTPPRDLHCKTVDDIDGDGDIDVMAASAVGDGLHWYRYPDWSAFSISAGSFTTDMQAADIDGDGDADAVIPDSSGILWFENPRPSGNPAGGTWTRRLIGSNGANHHDVEVGDLNRDGRLDVVTRMNFQATYAWIQGTGGAWTRLTVSTDFGEGVALGDIDGDGDLDIAHDGFWLQNPGHTQNVAWTRRNIASGWPNRVGVTLADLDGDGRLDVALAPSETSSGRLSWYRTSNPLTGPWTETVIDSTVSYIHTFKAGDMDRDGDLDLVTAEMHQSSDPDEVSVYWNEGNGLSWTQQVLSSAGSHNIRIADLEGDGDLDVVGANWASSAPGGAPLEWWESLLSSNPPPPPASAPVIQPAGGTFQDPVTVTLSSSTSGAEIRTTLDGTDPSGTSTLYAGPFVISQSSTLKARAFAQGFSPSSISSAVFTIQTSPPPGDVPTQGLALWLRADDGPVLEGSAVSRWIDSSGNGRDALQATSAQRPTFVPDAVNGLPAIRFDGIDDFLSFNLPVNGLQGMTIFLVSSCTADRNAGATGAASATSAAIFWNETASWGTVYLSPYQTNIKTRFGTTQSQNLLSYTRPASIGSAFTITTSRKDGSVDSLFVDGVQVLSQGGKLSSIAACRSDGALGRGYNDNTFFPGLIAEVLVYTRALTSEERADVEAYLRQSYSSTTTPPPPAATPVIQPAGGTFQAPVTVTLSSSTSGGEIRYTLDGVDPSGSSTLYAGPFTIGQSATLKARTFAQGFSPSSIASAVFTIQAPPPPPASAPVIQPAGGTFQDPVTVTLSSSTSGAEIRTTLDGTDPSGTSTLYAGPFVISQSSTLKARAFAQGFSPSSISSAVFTIQTSPPPGDVPSQGLALWLRADDGPVLEGSAVSRWIDSSGNGRDAIQASSAQRPVFVPDAVNGLPAIRFDGLDDFLSFNLPVNGLQGMTIFLVSSCTADRHGGNAGAASATGAAIFWNETASWGTVYLSPYQTLIKMRFGTTQSQNLPSYTRPTSIGSAFTITTSRKDGSVDSLFVDGVQVLSQGGKLSSITGCRNDGALGRGYNDNTFFPGLIAEVLVYTRALTSEERAQVETYLMGSYGPR